MDPYPYIGQGTDRHIKCVDRSAPVSRDVFLFPHAWYSQEVLSYRASKTCVSSLIVSTQLFGSINQRAHSSMGLGLLSCWASQFSFRNGLGPLAVRNLESNPSREIRKPIHKTNRGFSEANFRSATPLASIRIKSER